MEHWRRLAELIRDEQDRLYDTQEQFARAADVSLRTVEDLIAGKRTRYRSRTLNGIEAALHWEAGSVQRVLEGRKPVRATDPVLARIVRAWPELSERDRKLLAMITQAMLS